MSQQHGGGAASKQNSIKCPYDVHLPSILGCVQYTGWNYLLVDNTADTSHTLNYTHELALV